MATQLDFYVDTFRQQMVAGVQSSSIVQVPHFSYGDTYTLRIRALNQTANFPSGNPPYTALANTGKTLQLAIGNAVNGQVLTQQYTWSLSTDPNDPYFYADVAFNTAPIQTAIQGQSTIQSTLEIKLVDVNPKTIFRQTVNIDNSIVANQTLVIPPGTTPATMEAVLALLKNLRVNQITLLSPNGSHQETLWIDNDGSPHNDIS